MSYEKISDLGDFLQYFSDYADFDQYDYFLMDDSDVFAQLTVRHHETSLEKILSKKVELSSETGAYLTESPHSETGYILINDFMYYYYKGRLYGIRWVSEDTEFCLWQIESRYGIMDLPADTLLLRLLCAETAYEATQELREMTCSVPAAE